MQQSPQTVARLLEMTYALIQRERMADVPILHPDIRVEAVGFREWQGHAVGILVTPWFMNLMRVSLEDAKAPSARAVGESFDVALPSGSVEFLQGHEDGFGNYAMCSLSSPMFDYENHEAAIATAEAAIEAFFDAGEEPAEEQADTPAPSKTVSRRALFTGLAEAAEQ